MLSAIPCNDIIACFFSFDKSVGHFLGWLSEMESNVDNLEFQVENSQDGLRDNLPGALDEIKVKKKESGWGSKGTFMLTLEYRFLSVRRCSVYQNIA